MSKSKDVFVLESLILSKGSPGISTKLKYKYRENQNVKIHWIKQILVPYLTLNLG